MKGKLNLLAFSFVIQIMGAAILMNVSWKIAVGVLVFVWGHDIALSIDKR